MYEFPKSLHSWYTGAKLAAYSKAASGLAKTRGKCATMAKTVPKIDKGWGAGKEVIPEWTCTSCDPEGTNPFFYVLFHKAKIGVCKPPPSTKAMVFCTPLDENSGQAMPGVTDTMCSK